MAPAHSLVASAGFFAYDLYTFRTDTVRNLGIEAQMIGSNSISALLFDDPHSAENTLSALRAAPHVMFAEIYTPDGRSFAGYRRDNNGAFPPPPADSTRSGAKSTGSGVARSHWSGRLFLGGSRWPRYTSALGFASAETTWEGTSRSLLPRYF